MYYFIAKLLMFIYNVKHWALLFTELAKKTLFTPLSMCLWLKLLL